MYCVWYICMICERMSKVGCNWISIGVQCVNGQINSLISRVQPLKISSSFLGAGNVCIHLYTACIHVQYTYIFIVCTVYIA